MARLCILLLAWAFMAWPGAAQQTQEPPEEDEALAEKEYSFNPLQADKEMKVGEFYFKKGSYKAAVLRFREAAKWNPGLAQAWLRLGDAEQKLGNEETAREAYAKFVELAPKDKRAAQLRKNLAVKRERPVSTP